VKKNIVFIFMFFVLISIPVQVVANPKSVVDDPVYEFDAIPEGPLVDAEFIIKNTGTDVLIIEKVAPP